MGLAKRDLSGEKFGRWTVIEKIGPYLHNGKRKDWLYKCQCDCGTVNTVKSGSLTRGVSKSCGCLTIEVNSEIHLHTLIGQEFGDWVVLERGTNRWTPKNQTKTYWRCKCKYCFHIQKYLNFCLVPLLIQN
jgi:hypothetical protein